MIESIIEGVAIKEILRYNDERGWLSEIYRQDSDNFKAVMSYVSHTCFNQIRGPHEHKHQTDFFIFIGYGNFEVYLWDNRKNSRTYDSKIRFTTGESNKRSLVVPPGIVHGYKSTSKNGSFSINLPDKLYKGWMKKEDSDEIRYENDKNSKFKIK